MSAFEHHAYSDLVPFGYGVLDPDMQIGKAPAEVTPEWLKLCRATDFCASLAQTERYPFWRKQLIDGLLATLVPYLLEPAMYQLFIIFLQERPSLVTTVPSEGGERVQVKPSARRPRSGA